MDNQNPQEQAVAVEIAAETTEQPISKMKAAIAEMSARQILKLTLPGSGAHCLVSDLQPAGPLLPLDRLRRLPDRPRHPFGRIRRPFSSWISPRSSCCCS